MDATAAVIPSSRARGRAFGAWAWLAAIVVPVALVRFALALAHGVPSYLPDEYVYASIARALGHGHGATVRGEHAPFPALLQPLLTAPLWRAGSVQTGYALVKALNALAMASSAVPLYLLARRVRLERREALLCAVFGAVSPNLAFVSFALSNPISYPLALAAVVAAVATLESPTPRRQLLFLLLAGLASFASIQFVVLPVALLAAAVVVERGQVLRAARGLRLTLTLGAVGALALLVRPGSLGIYRHAPGLGGRLGPAEWAHWLGVGGFLLALAAGAAIVPGALAALAHTLVRGRDRTERAFAAFLAALALLLLVEAAPVEVQSGRFAERYLLVLSPLLAVAFLVWCRQRFPFRAVAGVAAGALLLALPFLPLSKYAVRYGPSDSPLLSAVAWLVGRLGTGGGALVVAAACSLGALTALALALRPSRAAALAALGVALAALVATSALASAYMNGNARAARARQPDDLSWIDHTGARHVTLLATLGARPASSVLTLFWNPHSLDRETLLGRGIALDQYSAPRLVVRRDGALLRDGSPLTTPLLVDATGTVARFAGARLAQQVDGYELWRPAGTPRLELLGEGFWRDGRLDTRSDVRLWPAGTARLRGTLVLGFRADAARRSLLRLSWPGGSADVRLAPGQSQRVRLPIDTARPFTLRIDALAGSMFDGSRRTAGFAAPPVFVRS